MRQDPRLLDAAAADRSKEKEKRRLKLVRQAEYQQVVNEAKAEGNPTPNIWSFESLFPDPLWDEACIKRDLYSIKDQDKATMAIR